MTALSDLRVLDLSTHVAGPFCTKLFADFGADVIKVEPSRHGDEARRLGPFPDATPNPEASGLFLYLNTNKRGITLNLDTPTGRELLHELVATADVLVESFCVGMMEQMGLDFATLETIRPGIVLTSITPFGQTGPWRKYQATDLIVQATSGLSAVNRMRGGPPLREPGYQTGYQGGACAFLGTMSAICYRDRQPKRILVGMALDVPRLVNDPHLQARRFFVEAEHTVAGKLVYAGAPFKMAQTPWGLRATAPLLGQHNEEIYLGLLGHQHHELAQWQAEGVI